MSLVNSASRKKLSENEHCVSLYENDGALLSLVTTFMANADAVVIVAREEKLKQFKKALKLKSNVHFLDAHDTLSKFMVKGLPHPQLFARTVGKLMHDLTASNNNVKAFGEMVALLWDEGNTAGAILLEELWNNLQTEYHFSLLCAYPINCFKGEHNAKKFSYMCSCHSSVFASPQELEKIEKGFATS
ncbi:MAG: MEDS domain-containing protein [bacterium]|nr:MEDS domain-containing protein [bacterium]